MALTVKAPSNATTLVNDTFTDTNGVDLTAHTPDTKPTGSVWAMITGTAEIQTNRVEPSSAVTEIRAQIETNISNQYIAAEVEFFQGSGTSTVGLIGRYVDDNNYWLGYIDDDNDQVVLADVVAGVETIRASIDRPSGEVGLGFQDIHMYLIGDKIIFFSSTFAFAIEFDSTTHINGTGAGIYSKTTGTITAVSTHNDFTVKQLPGGTLNKKADDTFTDSDTTALTAHTPDIDPTGDGWIVGEGTFEIISNKAVSSVLGPLSITSACIETGFTDQLVEGTGVAGVTTLFEVPGLIGRAIDENNTWIGLVVPSADEIRLFERISGTFTQRVSAGSVNIDILAGVAYKMTLWMIDDFILFFETTHGFAVSFTSITLRGATLAGIFTQDTGTVTTETTIDDFSVKKLQASAPAEQPVEPTLAVVDDADGTGATATISGGDNVATNEVFTAEFNGETGALSDWTSKGSRTGNGDVDLSLSNGYHMAHVESSF